MIDLKLLRDQSEEVIAIYRDRLFDDDAAQIARKLLELDAPPPPDRGPERRAQAAAQHRVGCRRTREGSGPAPAAHRGHGGLQGADRASRPGDRGARRRDAAARAAAAQPSRSVGARRQERRREPGCSRLGKTSRHRQRCALERSPSSRIGSSARRSASSTSSAASRSRGRASTCLRGVGARLQRALITWMLDVHIEQGYTEIYPPYMVKGECLVGTAQLPKFADTVYRDIEEDFYFVPTAEVPVTNMYRDEVLDAAICCPSSTSPTPPAFGARRWRTARTRAASSAAISSTRSRW